MKNRTIIIIIFLVLSVSCTSVQIQDTIDDIQSKSSHFLHEQGIVVKNDPAKDFDVTPYRTNTPDKQATSISTSLNNSVFSNPEANLQVLVTTLLKGIDDPVRQAKILHDWIALNISYNVIAFSNGEIPDQSYSSVLKSKKAVCEGYSNLYLKMCSLAKIKCQKVSGYARGVGFNPLSQDTSLDSNHAWNAVFLNGNWYLVDTTWDAGHVTGCYKTSYSYAKRYSTSYFLLDPMAMLHTHFPSTPMWQLLNRQLSRNEFLSLPYLTGDFFDSVEATEPTISAINMVANSATLRLRSKAGKALSAFLSDEKGSILESSTLITYYDGFSQIQIAFPKAGSYSLQLFAGQIGKTHSSIGEIVYSASSGSELVFPEQYDSSIGNNYKIFSPLTGNLKTNKETIFLLSIPNIKTAYIAYNKEFLPMLASEDGNFYLKLTPTKKGDKIMVLLPSESRKGSYESILSYSVVD